VGMHATESPVPTPTTRLPRPVIVGHRGAPAYRPEHTTGSYELAIAQGADLIEPDIVVSKDGVLVARHENELSQSTDIAGRPDFAYLRTTKQVGEEVCTGWFAEDLTLAELRTLHAVERLPQLRPRPGGWVGPCWAGQRARSLPARRAGCRARRRVRLCNRRGQRYLGSGGVQRPERLGR